jgi:uncharacterized protein (UPF0261 family)
VATVVLRGTADTNGAGYAFLAERLRSLGVAVVVVDCGVLGRPSFEADVTREEVAAAGYARLAAGDQFGKLVLETA